MRPLICFFCLFSLLSCRKEQEAQPKDEYVPGMLFIGVKANASIESVFTLTNANGVSIIGIYGYVYKSPEPKDSIASLAGYLNTKKYIDTFGWKAGVVYTVKDYTAVESVYQYMDTVAQKDWINTMQQLQLTEVIPNTDSLKYLWVTVPDGQEHAMMDVIKKDPIVSVVDVNHIYHMQLF